MCVCGRMYLWEEIVVAGWNHLAPCVEAGLIARERAGETVGEREWERAG